MLHFKCPYCGRQRKASRKRIHILGNLKNCFLENCGASYQPYIVILNRVTCLVCSGFYCQEMKKDPMPLVVNLRDGCNGTS